MESQSVNEANKGNTVNQQRKRHSGQNDHAEVNSIEAISNVNNNLSIDEVIPAKKTRVATKPRAARQPKLRPEDERTMKILAEKFHLDQNGGMQCQEDGCTSSLHTAKPANLKRHIAQVHPKMFTMLFPNEVDSQIKAQLDAFNSEQDAIELVTVNGYPFTILNASGMRGFLSSRLEPLRFQGHVVEINRQNIARKVAEASEIIRNRIRKEVKGKIVSVLFDVCTISTLSTFGVNVTYMENSKVICRSLGIIKIDERHTAVNLADMLFDLLAKFEIPLTNVFSITTDTARNATNTTQVLNTIMSNASTDLTLDIEPDDDLEFGIDIENEIERSLIKQIRTHC